MNLATARYAGFNPDWGVPVRTSVGKPKWIDYPMAEAMALAPWELFKKTNEGLGTTDQIRVYRAQLHRNRARIESELALLEASYPGQRLVILCYEDIHAGKYCHRRWFADWAKETWGIEVPELTVAVRPKPEAPRLF